MGHSTGRARRVRIHPRRVATVIKIDDRRDRDVRMQDKVRAVEEQLGRDRET